ncbi:Hypothetical protein A7982_06792 [Minicystis rosea]|nr:Hypothetical protein A7982_06792 [Minicystis rosea]
MRSEGYLRHLARRHTFAALLLAGALPFAAGCGGSPTAPAQDQVFYLHGGSGVIDRNYSWETYFKPLDQPAGERTPRIVGVGVLSGDVRIGRPIDWNVRSADLTPHHRFISYQSPRQFIFSIYERIDSPEDTWTDVERRYEADVAAQGSQILAGRMPVATANTQGRAYLIRTKVPAKPEYLNNAREVLIRGEHRLMLVQVVHTGDNVESIEDEIATVLKSITVY